MRHITDLTRISDKELRTQRDAALRHPKTLGNRQHLAAIELELLRRSWEAA